MASWGRSTHHRPQQNNSKQSRWVRVVTRTLSLQLPSLCSEVRSRPRAPSPFVPSPRPTFPFLQTVLSCPKVLRRRPLLQQMLGPLQFQATSSQQLSETVRAQVLWPKERARESERERERESESITHPTQKKESKLHCQFSVD